MAFLDTISQLAENYTDNTSAYMTKSINKSEFDKTYIGRVVDKETIQTTSVQSEAAAQVNRWLIAANGSSYYVDASNSDIKSVGQKVRLYIPSNNRNKIYAEVINPATAPDKIVYTENDENFSNYKEYGVDADKDISESDVTIDTIVETWGLADMTNLERTYIMTVINADTDNEEVTNIICPDGKKINLEGFIIG